MNLSMSDIGLKSEGHMMEECAHVFFFPLGICGLLACSPQVLCELYSSTKTLVNVPIHRDIKFMILSV